MEKSKLYEEISDFLTSNGFSAPTDDIPCFRTKMVKPGRTVVINGQRMDEPDETINFDITPLGPGAILGDNGDPDIPLEGFNVLNSDLWVRSLDDLQYWLTLARVL